MCLRSPCSRGKVPRVPGCIGMSHNLSLVVCLVRRNEKGRAHGGRKVYAPDPAVDCLRMWCFPQCRTITTAPVYQSAPRARVSRSFNGVAAPLPGPHPTEGSALGENALKSPGKRAPAKARRSCAETRSRAKGDWGRGKGPYVRIFPPRPVARVNIARQYPAQVQRPAEGQRR